VDNARALDVKVILETDWAAERMCRSIANWRSPVLFVHGDADRNVPFQQTTDLVEKLRVSLCHRFG
jgi:fermentation-respiration switch protein FrsA (DUF1100 family)